MPLVSKAIKQRLIDAGWQCKMCLFWWKSGVGVINRSVSTKDWWFTPESLGPRLATIKNRKKIARGPFKGPVEAMLAAQKLPQ